MQKLEQKYLDVLERNGWNVLYEEGDSYVEIEKTSHAGEDLVFDIEIEDFPHGVAKVAEDFDVDEHVATLIGASRSGFPGVPSPRILMDDAEATKEMLHTLANELLLTENELENESERER